ncbi:hypothetical protein [Neisseria sp. Ec49-e6-T10]|uniref:hypothetical protein n=1 Tax=Neisseria sp. Ec49-e6-T10 TaxID=3140744 RepID=UPI003EBE93C8
MAKFRSVADISIEILESAKRPLTAKEIDNISGNVFGSDNICHSLKHWVKKGVIGKRAKKSYMRKMEYYIVD